MSSYPPHSFPPLMNTVNLNRRKTASPGRRRAVGFRAPTSSSAAQPAVSSVSTSASPEVGGGHAISQPAARYAPPVKKRAKGSGFLGIIFITLFVTAGYLVWTQFLQYQSYGVIAGRTISVAAPWDGTVLNWQVREGEWVQQGQVVATISNLSMEHELAALHDELKMTQAQLDAEVTRVRFEQQQQSDRNQQATADYLQSASSLAAERARFEELEQQLERSGRLLKKQHASRAEFEKIFYQHAGQKRKIAKLQQAVQVLRIRSEQPVASDPSAGGSQLKPLQASITRIQSEILRLRERIDQGNVTAPVSGRIAKRHCLTGEMLKAGETVLQILEDNSVEAILYIPQQITDQFAVGSEIEVVLEPYQKPLRCVVSRTGEQFEPAPASIARYYLADQHLLPVHLTPRSQFS